MSPPTGAALADAPWDPFKDLGSDASWSAGEPGGSWLGATHPDETVGQQRAVDDEERRDEAGEKAPADASDSGSEQPRPTRPYSWQGSNRPDDFSSEDADKFPGWAVFADELDAAGTQDEEPDMLSPTLGCLSAESAAEPKSRPPSSRPPPPPPVPSFLRAPASQSERRRMRASSAGEETGLTGNPFASPRQRQQSALSEQLPEAAHAPRFDASKQDIGTPSSYVGNPF